MHDILYKHAAVITRYQAGPKLIDRERFLVHCAERGYTPRALKKIAWLLLIVVSSMPTGVQMVSKDEIRRRALSAKRSKHTQQILEKVAIEWYDFLGQLECERENTPISNYICAFEHFMREERGLSEVTIETRCQRVANCLHSLVPVTQSIQQLTVVQVDDYIHQKSGSGWCRSSLAALASDLRSFFRFAESQDWCRPGLSTLIEAPRLYSDERLPQSMAWTDVLALIDSISEDDPVSIRDRAIILLLAYYGLRRGEVARLELEHIDWQGETLKITRPKQRRFQCYPLIQPVGDALVRYLTEVRPRSEHRQVFLAMKAPVRPLSAHSICPIVRWRSAAVCDGAVAVSPHKLRHACAQHLLVEGFSLKQIGDQLGHRSATSTAIYTKIDLTQLRQVAEIDFGRFL